MGRRDLGLKGIEDELVLYRRLHVRWQDRFRPWFETPVFSERCVAEMLGTLRAEQDRLLKKHGHGEGLEYPERACDSTEEKDRVAGKNGEWKRAGTGSRPNQTPRLTATREMGT